MSVQLPLPIQTLYAELLDRSLIGKMAKEFDPSGTFIKKTMRNRDYYYFRSPMRQGTRTDIYVGPDSVELRERIERHKSEKDDYKQRRSLVAALNRVGLRGPDPKTGLILEALVDAGVFRMRGVVVGTAAFQTYPGLLGVKLANANAMTDDLDIAQFSTMSIAIQDEIDIPFIEVLRTVDPAVEPVARPISPSKATQFRLADNYRVDILTPNRGGDSDEPVALPASRTDAQPLRYLDFLIYQEVQAVALHGAGIPINVPAPERYALHKLIVSRERVKTSGNQIKSRKDLRQAGELLGALVDQRPYELKDLWSEFIERGPQWIRKASEALLLMDQEMGSKAIRHKIRPPDLGGK